MADHLRRELVLDAVGMALHQRKPAAGLVHHSDHGTQGGLNRLRSGALLIRGGDVDGRRRRCVRPRHGRELFTTLKEELLYRRAWPTRHELEMEFFSYIEGLYNPRRRHSRLGNLSPADYEQQITTRSEVCG